MKFVAPAVVDRGLDPNWAGDVFFEISISVSWTDVPLRPLTRLTMSTVCTALSFIKMFVLSPPTNLTL